MHIIIKEYILNNVKNLETIKWLGTNWNIVYY